jgi:hypothetical protein
MKKWKLLALGMDKTLILLLLIACITERPFQGKNTAVVLKK